MSATILILVSGYVIIALLLTIFCLQTRYHWGLKAVMIVVVSLFYSLNYFSMLGILGWPTEQELPDNFRLVAAQVIEANKLTGTEGAVYIWATPFDKTLGLTTPRAYQIPYSETLHQQLSGAVEKQKQGITQIGRKKKAESAGLPSASTQKAKSVPNTLEIEFYNLPETNLPEK